MKYLLILLFLSFSAAAQVNLKLEASLPLPDQEIFSADQFGNLYATRGGEFLKIDDEGKSLYSFSLPILGDINQIIVFDPMRPHLFYRDANTLVITDNRLNESFRLNFSEEGYFDVRFFGLAGQQNIWFYDQPSDRIFRFNLPNARVTNQSLNISQITDSQVEPTALVSTVDQVYLNLPKRGLLVFDGLGVYEKLIPMKGIENFDVNGDWLWAIRSSKLLRYNLESGQLEELKPPLGVQVRQLKYYRGKLYLYDGQKLWIFKITND